jgi:NADPH:quinone reductase-like Zn-dependent oxidoreductase
MKAIIYRQYGGPEVLEFTDVPEPKLSQTNVLIRVKAAALNPADHILQDGLGDDIMDAWFPVIPGWDVAGIVERTGAGVSEFISGDEVIGFVREEILRHGTYAEKVSAAVSAFVRKPRNATWAQAAALPLAGLTAYQAIVHALDIHEGKTLLIHGASGGVGSIAAQIALSRGAKVVGSASEINHNYLQSIGVQPVLYGDQFVEDVRRIVPEGFDTILDCAGRGVLSLIPQIGRAGVRACSIAGAAPGVKTVFARADQGDLMKLVELVESGLLVVPIAGSYSLADAAIAQQALRNGRNAPGKIVLEVDG